MTSKIEYPSTEYRPWPHGVMLDHMEKVHGTPRGNRSGLDDETLWAHDMLHKLPITPAHPHSARNFGAMFEHELQMHNVPGGIGWDWLHQICFPECDAALPVALLEGVRKGFDTAVGIFETREAAVASPLYRCATNPVIVATTRPLTTFDLDYEHDSALRENARRDAAALADREAAAMKRTPALLQQRYPLGCAIAVDREGKGEDYAAQPTQPGDEDKPKGGLYKSTIVIWSSFDPTNTLELSSLAREAEQGDAYCSVFRPEYVRDPKADATWDGTTFFDKGDDD